MSDEDKVINSRPAGAWASGAAIDVRRRNEEAYKKYQDFYDDPEYAQRVEQATKIIDDFFKVKDMYINLRENRGKPFTAIKVTNHLFPKVSLATKEKAYRKPLKDLDVTINYSPGTNSYLFHIK